ncbi:MAG TPA: DUF255 domain-containing protein [Enhygromyxa sp.]|nr:DUF255 domain-containing protein [Enhygromyxa sp.]
MSVLRIAGLALVLTGCATASPAPKPEPAATAHAALEFSAWEPASFERAAAEDKLILINVIATWCHWCHVMDEQTFANPEVAALLAEHFVVIRVDSDARPDVSERYRAWGWPASAFLSPQAEPALNLRGYRDPAVFAALLRELIAEHQRGALRRLDERELPERPIDSDLDRTRQLARTQLDGYFDAEALGWGSPQKYPWPEPIDYAFVRARFHGEVDWQARALATLEAQRALIDPVDGGMYQYSLRGVWDRPHFERIAMIQAGAIETYAHAAMITHDPRWLEPARAVASYVLGTLQDPRGGFHTSQDADLRRSDGSTIHGDEYYVLDRDARQALGIPRIDTAVYADLDGALIHALTELYRATGDEQYLTAAIRAGERLLATHRSDRGGFTHGPEAPSTELLHLADQAAVGWAFVALHRVTADPRWRDEALAVAEFMHGELAAVGGGYYAHSEDPRAVRVFAQRRRPLRENSLAAQFLIELAAYTDDQAAARLSERAHATLLAIGSEAQIESSGKVVGRTLIALELELATTLDITIVARPNEPVGDALWQAALGFWEPRAALERSQPGERYPDIGKPAAYLCSETACSRPITDPAKFGEQADAFIETLAHER